MRMNRIDDEKHLNEDQFGRTKKIKAYQNKEVDTDTKKTDEMKEEKKREMKFRRQ